MAHLDLFISLAGMVVSLLVTCITFIAKFCKGAKAKKVAEAAIEIGEIVLPLISQAEKLVNYTGEEKKNYVMTLVRQYALDRKLNVDYDSIADRVDELVSLSKEVNVGKATTPIAEIPQPTITKTETNTKIVNQLL